ncbi:hypothetical protein M9H77_02379 [Catharanthus roseus]|uniref:Uncharacterized protein n=1 Tax=Catharanthus roseus TaxID=4058 RepID=A0ACC0C8F7_CATRO|nr:hypothetical protein M9H77_02379 [Catharanthus roseus]
MGGEWLRRWTREAKAMACKSSQFIPMLSTPVPVENGWFLQLLSPMAPITQLSSTLGGSPRFNVSVTDTGHRPSAPQLRTQPHHPLVSQVGTSQADPSQVITSQAGSSQPPVSKPW